MRQCVARQNRAPGSGCTISAATGNGENVWIRTCQGKYLLAYPMLVEMACLPPFDALLGGRPMAMLPPPLSVRSARVDEQHSIDFERSRHDPALAPQFSDLPHPHANTESRRWRQHQSEAYSRSPAYSGRHHADDFRRFDRREPFEFHRQSQYYSREPHHNTRHDYVGSRHSLHGRMSDGKQQHRSRSPNPHHVNQYAGLWDVPAEYNAPQRRGPRQQGYGRCR